MLSNVEELDLLEGRLIKTKSRGFLVTLWLNIACYIELGVFERRLLPDSATVKIVLINFWIVLAGMGCRYLLEFGE